MRSQLAVPYGFWARRVVIRVSVSFNKSKKMVLTAGLSVDGVGPALVFTLDR